MGNSKRKKQELDPAEMQAEIERKQAKFRGKFEKKESKLKRHLLKSEVSLWDAELDLLEMYAEYAEDEQREAYEQEITELRAHLDNAHDALKQLKKNKKQNPAALASPGETWDEAAKAFDTVQEKLDQARPQL